MIKYIKKLTITGAYGTTFLIYSLLVLSSLIAIGLGNEFAEKNLGFIQLFAFVVTISTGLLRATLAFTEEEETSLSKLGFSILINLLVIVFVPKIAILLADFITNF